MSSGSCHGADDEPDLRTRRDVVVEKGSSSLILSAWLMTSQRSIISTGPRMTYVEMSFIFEIS